MISEFSVEFLSGGGGAVSECFAEHAGFAMRCDTLVVCYIFQVYISRHIAHIPKFLYIIFGMEVLAVFSGVGTNTF